MIHPAAIALRRLLRRGKRPLALPEIYAGHRSLSIDEGAEWLRGAILSGQPFMAARYGGNELNAMRTEHPSAQAIDRLCRNAGFFPPDVRQVRRFAAEMRACSADVDALGAFLWDGEEKIIERCAPGLRAVFPARALEPWYARRPWTRALAGKTVLVIHPFERTILRQYDRRQALFADPDVLPEFELRTLKAVVTHAGAADERFADWFDALDWMHAQARRIDFDVALIGCGAYGFPLAARIRRDGRQAVHMGGALQLLFGIRGARWDDHPVISRLYNEYWVRPDASERPPEAGRVERGCYW
ncbi:MAG: hypothetical protein Q4E13_02600 [Clostridia bacterium]|nr:hypothetical protein [Clostridia bacterium]